MAMEIIMDLQILYKDDKPQYVFAIDRFGLMKRIAGENNENLQYILDTTHVEMIVQTQPTGIHDGLQFTLEHKDISELEKAEGLLFMLLIKIKTEFEDFMNSLNAPQAVTLMYKIHTAKCGVCGKTRSSTVQDFVKHVNCHFTQETVSEPGAKLSSESYGESVGEKNSSPLHSQKRSRERSMSPYQKRRRESTMESPPIGHSSLKSPRNIVPSEKSESPHFLQGDNSRSPGNRHSVSSRSTMQSSPIIYYNLRTPGRTSHSEKSKTSHFPQGEKSISTQPSRSKSPVTKRRSPSPHHRRSYSPRRHDRLKSPKETERNRTWSAPNSSTKSCTDFEKQYRDTAPLLISSRTNKEDRRTSRSDKSRTPENPADLSLVHTEDSQAVRDLLQQGLGPRTKQYCDITDEMILYPHISEPEYVAEGRKRILLSGCESGSISIKKAKTALWLLLWKGLASHEKELVDKEVMQAESNMKLSYGLVEVSQIEQMAIQLQVVCDFFINRSKSSKGFPSKEPYPYQHLLKAEEGRVNYTKPNTSLQDFDKFGVSTPQRSSSSFILDPDPGEFQPSYRDITDFMIENSHPDEPDFVALGRRYFLLKDRYDGRTKDDKASRILQRLKCRLSTNEERKVSDMVAEVCRKMGKSCADIPRSHYLTICLRCVCDDLVAKARQNKNKGNYPYLKNVKSPSSMQGRIDSSAKLRATDRTSLAKELQQEDVWGSLQEFETESQKSAAVSENLEPMVSNNGQYKLNVEAEHVKVNALSWIGCLKEQNQIEAVYNMAPWSKSVTLHLGVETHITSGASSPSSGMQPHVDLKQQVALEALMKTSYCFKKIPPSLKSYGIQNAPDDNGDVLHVEPPSSVVSDLTQQVTSTVNIDDATDAQHSCYASEKLDVIQSSDVSQSTDNNDASSRQSTNSTHTVSANKDAESVASSKEYLDYETMIDSGTLSTEEHQMRDAELHHDKDNETSSEKPGHSNESESNQEIIIIKRNKTETVAKQYLQELHDSETDEQSENMRRLTELENSLNETDKTKIAKSVSATLFKLKSEMEWKEVPTKVEISAKLEVTCKYILQKGTARQLLQAAKRKAASSTANKRKLGAVKGKPKSTQPAKVPLKTTPNKTTKPTPKQLQSKSGSSTKVKPAAATGSTNQSKIRTRMKRRAADFLKALDEGKLTESQEAHRFTIVYSTLSRDEKVAVDKQVNDELEAIKKEMDYSGEVRARVKVQVQLDIVCKHILEESKGGNPSGERSKPSAGTSLVAKEGKKEKIPETKSESSAEIELPWISDLEPSSSKGKSMKERLTALERYVRLNLEVREEGLMSDVETVNKIKSIKRDIVADYKEINNQVSEFTKDFKQKHGKKCPDTERITEHYRITCEYILKKFKNAVENPPKCIVEYV